MAEFFSDQFAAAGTETAANDTGYRVPMGGGLNGSGRVIAKTTTNGTANGDVFRMIPNVSSAARLWELQCQIASTPSAGTFSIGLHLSGYNHDGAVVDDNLFESAQSVTSGLALADVFTGAALTNLQRGVPIWELLGLSSDPGLLYDITITTATGIATASDVVVMLVAEFLEPGL